MSGAPILSSAMSIPQQIIPTTPVGETQVIVQALAQRQDLPAPVQADIHELVHDLRSLTFSGISDDDWAQALASYGRRAQRILELGLLLRSSDAILAF